MKNPIYHHRNLLFFRGKPEETLYFHQPISTNQWEFGTSMPPAIHPAFKDWLRVSRRACRASFLHSCAEWRKNRDGEFG